MDEVESVEYQRGGGTTSSSVTKTTIYNEYKTSPNYHSHYLDSVSTIENKLDLDKLQKVLGELELEGKETTRLSQQALVSREEEDSGAADPFQENVETLLDWFDGCGNCLYYDSADEHLGGLQFISGESRLDLFGGMGGQRNDDLVGLAFVEDN